MSGTTEVRQAFSPQRGTAYTQKATAFAVIGDRYHNSDYIRVALGKTLVSDAGVSIDFTDEVSLLSADTLHGYRMLIVFRDGMVWPQGYGSEGSYPGYVPTSSSPLLSVPTMPVVEAKPHWWMTPDQGKAVKQFVEEGGSALFYHNSSNISLSNEDFRDVEGAIYTGHPPVRPFTVRIVNPTHPITQGLGSGFEITDEVYLAPVFEDSVVPLLRSTHEFVADGFTPDCGVDFVDPFRPDATSADCQLSRRSHPGISGMRFSGSSASPRSWSGHRSATASPRSVE